MINVKITWKNCGGMEVNMRVSIVMSTYNGEKYLKEQIDSILSSTYQDIDLYIHDDGSSDRTMELLAGYSSRYPDRIHVCRKEVNLGYTLNFLQGVCHTTADYVMLCDQDDVWKPDKIRNTLKRMRNMEGQLGKEVPIAVFTDAEVVDQSLNTLNASFFRSGKLDPRKTDLPHILMENKLIGCTVMINAALRRVLKSRSLPAMARYHDWWIALIAAACGKIGYLPEQTLLYRQHGTNVVGSRSFLSYIKDRITSLEKQRMSVLALEKQAEEFLELYRDYLSEDKLRVIHEFAQLQDTGCIRRRIVVYRNGYLKTGLIKNLGLMFIV